MERSRTESLHVGLNRTTGCWPHLGVSEFLEQVKWGLVDLFTSPFENITENNCKQVENTSKRLGRQGSDPRLSCIFIYVSIRIFSISYMYLTKVHGIGFELGV